MAVATVAPLYRDPLNPYLKNSPAVHLTPEQDLYVHEILELCCSDSKFAEKAYLALGILFLGSQAPPPVPPTVTGLTPNTVVVGAEDFILSVVGTGFTADTLIYIRGVVAPTTLVSATEVTTAIDMALVLAPTVAPITVMNGDLVSNPMDFTVTDVPPIVLSAPAKKSLTPEKIKEIGDNITKKHDEREG